MEQDHDVPALIVQHKWLVSISVMMATVMQILDTTIANVALPHMQTSLGATADTVTWVLTSYMLATAVAIPITGWLSDQFGVRRLFILSVVGFTLSSMLCGIATNLPEMVGFRVMQGVSAAFIGPLSQSVMLDINKPSQHARAMSIWGMGIMVGPILGPVLGGWLTENFNWRWVFYINVPFGIATTLIFIALLRDKPIRKRRFDMFGFAMLAIGLSALQLMLDRGHQVDWFDSWEVLLYLGIAISAGWIFIVHSATSPHPLFDRAIFANSNLVSALAFMLVVGLVMFASAALIPPMLQNLFGYPVIDTGFMMAPRGVGVLVSMAIAGRLVTLIDPRILMVTGASLSAWSFWLMSGWSLEMDWWPVVSSGVVQGMGMGLVFIPMNTLAFATLSPQFRTDGASLLNLSRSIGASVSISFMTALFARNVQVSHNDLVGHVTDSSLTTFDYAELARFGQYGDAILTGINGEITRQAAMVAYIDDFWLMMLINIAAIPLLLLLRRPKNSTAIKPPLMMD
ncbi:MAG: DHA2 family efflux MFS transporter permease subunit [Blastomonas sp.]